MSNAVLTKVLPLTPQERYVEKQRRRAREKRLRDLGHGVMGLNGEYHEPVDHSMEAEAWREHHAWKAARAMSYGVKKMLTRALDVAAMKNVQRARAALPRPEANRIVREAREERKAKIEKHNEAVKAKKEKKDAEAAARPAGN